MRTTPGGQPIGDPLPGWTPRPRPDADVLRGRWCHLEALDPDRHAADLHDAFRGAPESLWTYLTFGPFEDVAAARTWARSRAGDDGSATYVVVDAEGAVAGTATFMRVDPGNGVLEIGSVVFTPRHQRTRTSTDAISAMMRHALDDLGYRRVEWKCDRLNQPSRRAALRLGFTFEGTFRQAVVYRGRNRDTDWFAVIDPEWSRIRAAHDAWLDPANFDALGGQRAPLAAQGIAGVAD